MRKLTQFTFLLSVLAFTCVFMSCSKEEDTTPEPTEPTIDQKAVLEFLEETAEFSSFLEALKKTGLDNVIRSNEDLTIFAPTNDAFEALFIDNGWGSLDDISPGALNIVIQYHISTSGKLMSDGFTNNQTIQILYQERDLILKLDDPDLPKVTTGGFSIANIPVRDLEATDGVIHKIDKVLVP